MYTELSMIQGARIQYRAYFRSMSDMAQWNLYEATPGETLSGVVLAPKSDMAHLQPLEQPRILVEQVQSMSEETMVNALAAACRSFKIPKK